MKPQVCKNKLGVMYIFNLHLFIRAMSEQGRYMNFIPCHWIMPGVWVSVKNFENN